MVFYVQSMNNVIMNNNTDIRNNVFNNMRNDENIIYSNTLLTDLFTSDSTFPSYPKIIIHEGHIFGKGIMIVPNSVTNTLILNGCDLQDCMMQNIGFMNNILQNIIVNNKTNLVGCSFDMSSNQFVRADTNELFTSDPTFPSFPKIIISNGHIVGPGIDFSDVSLNTILISNTDLRNSKFSHNIINSNVDFSGCIMNNNTTFNDCVFIDFDSIKNPIYDEQGQLFTSDETFPSYPELIIYNGFFFGPGIINVTIPIIDILHLPDVSIRNLTFPIHNYSKIIMNNHTDLTNVYFNNLVLNDNIILDTSDNIFESDISFQSHPLIQVQNGYIYGPGIQISNQVFLDNNFHLQHIDFSGSIFIDCSFTNTNIFHTNFTNCLFTDSISSNMYIEDENTQNGKLYTSTQSMFPSHPSIQLKNGNILGPGINTTIFNKSLANYDLRGLHLSNCLFDSFNFENVQIDEHTRFSNTVMHNIKSGNINYDTGNVPFGSSPPIHIKKGYILGTSNQTDLSNVNFSNIYINDIILNDNLSNCDLTMSEFSNIDLTSVTIETNKVNYLTGYNITPLNMIFDYFNVINGAIVQTYARYKNTTFDGSGTNINFYLNNSYIHYYIENCIFQNFVTTESLINVTIENCDIINSSFINCSFQNSKLLNNTFDNTSSDQLFLTDTSYDFIFHNNHIIDSGITLSPNTNLDGLTLVNETLSNFNAQTSQFTNSTMNNISFYNCNFQNSDFNNSKIHIKDLSNVNFLNASFENTQLTFDIHFSISIDDVFNEYNMLSGLPESFIYNNILIFNTANLSNYDLSYLDVSNTDILSGCNFTNTNLSFSKLYNNNLNNSNFINSNLNNLESSGNYLLDINNKTSLNVSEFPSSPFTMIINGYIFGPYVLLHDLSFQNIIFNGINMYGTNFERTNFTQSTFKSCFMNNYTNLLDCDLTHVKSENITTFNTNGISELFNSDTSFPSYPDTIVADGNLFGFKTINENIDVSDVVFYKTNFKQNILRDISFVNCSFSHVLMDNNTIFDGSSFDHCTSSDITHNDVSFTSSPLFSSYPDIVIVQGHLIAKNTILRSKHFKDFQFNFTDFRSIDFSGTIFDNCNFYQVKMDFFTNFTNCSFVNCTSSDIYLFDNSQNRVPNSNSQFISFPDTIVVNNFLINSHMNLSNVLLQNTIIRDMDFTNRSENTFEDIFKSIDYNTVDFINVKIKNTLQPSNHYFKLFNGQSERSIFVYYKSIDITNIQNYFHYDNYTLSLKTHLVASILDNDSYIRLCNLITFDGKFKNVYLINTLVTFNSWNGLIKSLNLPDDDVSIKLQVKNVNIISGTTNYTRDYSGGGLIQAYSMYVDIENCTSSIEIETGGGGLVGSHCRNINVKSCYTRNIYNSSSNSGGILGYYSFLCIIDQCYSTIYIGNTSGGMIGSYSTHCIIRDSYTTGDVTDLDYDITNISGSMFSTFCSNNQIINCYSSSNYFPFFAIYGENNTITHSFNNRQFLQEDTELITNLLLNTEIEYNISNKYILDKYGTNSNNYPLLKCFTEYPWNPNYYRNYNAHAIDELLSRLGDSFFMDGFNLTDSILENFHIDTINISTIDFKNAILNNVTSSNLKPVNSNSTTFYSEPEFKIRKGVLIGPGVDISGFQGLSGEFLAGLNLERANITNVDFTNVETIDLLPTNYDFSGVDAIIRNGYLVTSGVNLIYADLSNTTISLNELHDVTLYDADLTNISFVNTYTYNIDPPFSVMTNELGNTLKTHIGYPEVTIFNGSIITQGVMLKNINLQNALLDNRVNFSNITSSDILPTNSSRQDRVSIYDNIFVLNGTLFAPNVLITRQLNVLDIRRNMNINFINLNVDKNIHIITETNDTSENINNTNIFIKDDNIQIYNLLSLQSYMYTKKYNIK